MNYRLFGDPPKEIPFPEGGGTGWNWFVISKLSKFPKSRLGDRFLWGIWGPGESKSKPTGFCTLFIFEDWLLFPPSPNKSKMSPPLFFGYYFLGGGCGTKSISNMLSCFECFFCYTFGGSSKSIKLSFYFFIIFCTGCFEFLSLT